jgi:hypothetical protein
MNPKVSKRSTNVMVTLFIEKRSGIYGGVWPADIGNMLASA